MMECLKKVLGQSDEPVLLRVAGSVGDACAGSGKSWRPPSKQLEGRQSGLPTSNLPAICRKSSSGLDRSPLALQPSAPSPPDAPQIQVSTSSPSRTSRPRFFPQSLWACGGHRWLAAPSPWKGLQSGPSMVKSKQDGGRSQHKHQSSYAKKRKVQVSQVSLSCLTCLSLPLSERLDVRVGWVGPKSSWSI